MNDEGKQIQVAYLSFATRALKADLDNQIQDILEIARKHNAEKNITGQLVYRSGIFLQLLEGSKGDITALLGRILLDHSRHESIKILLHQPLQERIFPDWSMAFKNLENAAQDLVDCIVPWQKLASLPVNKNNNDEILKIFSELAD